MRPRVRHRSHHTGPTLAEIRRYPRPKPHTSAATSAPTRAPIEEPEPARAARVVPAGSGAPSIPAGHVIDGNNPARSRPHAH